MMPVAELRKCVTLSPRFDGILNAPPSRLKIAEFHRGSLAREALIVEALGEAATLIRQVEALAPRLDESRQALADAHSGLADQLTTFEAHVAALTEKAKVQTVKHIAVHTDEAARKSIDLQSRAMAEAARVAFNTELGPTLQRVQWVLQPLIERPDRRWEQWLTHLAAAAMAAAAIWTLALWLLRS